MPRGVGGSDCSEGSERRRWRGEEYVEVELVKGSVLPGVRGWVTGISTEEAARYP
jgi:hypothetical protein